MTHFNLNDNVFVKITLYGWKYLYDTQGEKYVTHCILPYKKEIDGEEWHGLQGHQIITLFGGATWCATKAPIEMNVLIETEN